MTRGRGVTKLRYSFSGFRGQYHDGLAADTLTTLAPAMNISSSAAGGSQTPAIACPARNLARTISFCIEVALISPTCAVRTSQLDTSHMREIFGPAGEQDARAAYLFFCPSTNRYGVTLDKFGSNLPQQGGDAGWQLQVKFPLGIHEALPAPMDPEPVLRGIMAVGYFVWRAGPVRNPRGTSQ